MGNQQIYPKRQNLQIEQFVQSRNPVFDKRIKRIIAKSAPPIAVLNSKIPSVDGSPVTFSCPALPFDTYATVTGTFNNWIEQKMSKINGEYQLTIDVPSGCHYYRILVNGRARFQRNEMIEDHRDFGRVQFLYVEPHDEIVKNVPIESTKVSINKLDDWSQNIDQKLTEGKHAAPPRIPAHLLDVFLNRKLKTNSDPKVLPEPNSVILGHLCALSIRDGMMILSTTVRYKQKFVTMCFYKPN